MMNSRGSAVGGGVILTAHLLFGFAFEAQAQAEEPSIPESGARWGLVDAIGYGGLGFALGLLATWYMDGSGSEPEDPPGAAQALGSFTTVNVGIAPPTVDVGPRGAALGIIAATTVAGILAGAMIGSRAQGVVSEGGRIDGVHRVAVIGGAVMAGGTLGALAATPLRGDDLAFGALVVTGSALGALYVFRHRHEFGSRTITVTPARTGAAGYGLHVRVSP